MYETNGAFGQVRLAELMEPLQNPALYTLYNIGWHCCNDLYRFHRPEGTGRHLLLFTVRGEGFLRMRGREHALGAGSIALLPREEPHSYGTPDGGLWEFYWIHPSGAAQPFLDEVMKTGRLLMDMESGYAYSDRVEEMLSLCTLRPPQFEWRLSQKLSELLHHIAVRLCAGEEQLSLSRQLINMMESRYAEKFTLEDAAQELYVSAAHLIRLFRRETGCTPHWYLTQYRLMRAEQLLKYSAQSVADIARQTGFSSSSHLISQFRQAHGCTPEQFRHSAAVTHPSKV